MKEQKIKPKKKGFRFICAVLHRDLGYLFAGIVLIYAISGIAMNHHKSFNPNFSVENISFSLPAGVASTYSDVGENDIDRIFALADCPRSQYTKHFKDGEGRLKILVKGGSTIVADLSSRTADYEKVSPRPVLGSMVKLHYNPGRWWTAFADVFAVALILITLSGLFIIKGKNGITRRGIVLFVIGILFPLAFLWL
ncbi:MAG: PepSY-associated TM helix domain-containing protein [Clostridium sp.]|nr:PepSY-associated TM helix domain-containing protein [Clostridium sp.]